MDAGKLKRGLRTEMELALCGEGISGEGVEPSVVLLIKPRRLPRALVTDSRGVVTAKVVDYVDLLTALDRSAVVTELEKEPVRTLKIPGLPEGAVLLDVVERPSGSSYVVSGATRPSEHLVVVEGGKKTTTHEVRLPAIAYRAVWDSRTRRLSALSLALCSPDLQGEPNAETELFRWPFSNVYSAFTFNIDGANREVLEGVCWPTMRLLEMDLAEVPEKAVEGFVSVPNNADGYTRDLSRNAPVAGYRPFLQRIEERGGILHDWLEPCAMTLKDLHEQRRRKS
ncbi:hypothetical protein GBA65_21880 (plasmid) [Rubrobacter marinus]|uniref:Uncharacterized protein n=1 Tax=Rubrobacter marinus TaxID=2653852 RepID=A0A6G8Q445_9ACTN|nr:hypothetical protein [Rubrobacter marinus]QIN81087.1 hypothetical protein GBA65_21880 [Rubrobacter marinus]